MDALLETERPPAAAPAAAAPADGDDCPTASTAEPAQYLTFLLADEVYAINILGIKEIIEYPRLTVVPTMPSCVRGVINLRGAVVPVMDLQARFGRPSSAITKASCIVIVEIDDGQGPQVIGAVVDAVHEVISIAAADIEPPPAFGARIRSDFMKGIGKVRGQFVSLLDVEHVLVLDMRAAAA